MTTATWNTGSGTWFSVANWDEANPNAPPPTLHFVPGAADDAVIPDNAGTQTPFTVTYNGASTVNTLAGNLAGLLNITGGSLTLLNGGASNQMGVNLAAGATLDIAAGTLVATKGDFAGTISGNGTLFLNYGTFNLNAGLSLTVDNLVVAVTGNGTVSRVHLNANLVYGGSFTLADYSGNHAVLELHNTNLTLAGASNLDGTITGPGTVRITGSALHGSGGYGAPLITGGATLEYMSGSTGTQHATTTLGDGAGAGHLKINGGAVYTVDASSSLGSGAPAVATIVNNGAFNVTGAGVTAQIAAAFANSGAVTIGNGAAMRLGGGYASTLGGTIGGAGTLIVGNSGSTLNTANITVANLTLAGGNGGASLTLGASLTYAGTFSFSGLFDTLNLNARTLTLSGGANTLFGNNIDGGGTLKITGAAMLGGYVSLGTTTAITLQNAGAITQSGGVYLRGTILNDAGHTYTIATTQGLNQQGSATFTNNGTLSDTALGLSTMQGALVNNGALTIAAGATLGLTAGVKTLNGTVSGAGTLSFSGGAQATLNTSALTIAAITMNGASSLTLAKSLTYGGALSFANQFDSIDLNGFTLTLSGMANALNGNAIDGGGTLKITGAAAIGYDILLGSTTAMTLENAGAITQTGGVSLRGTLLNTAGHTYTIAGAGNIVAPDAATFTNNGTLAVTAAGRSEIGADFTSSGAIAIAAGAALRLTGTTATLNGTLSGAGAFELGRGTLATLNIASPTIAAITLVGGVFGPTLRLGTNLTYNGAFQSTGGSTLDLNGHTATLGNVLGFESGFIAGKTGATDRLIATGSAIDLSGTQFTGWTPGTDTIALNGTATADRLTGSSQADALSGLGGNDTLSGGGGIDTLTGGAGDDIYVNPTGDTILELAGGGSDTVESNLTFSLAALPQLENLTLTGNAAIDATGNGGNNILTGNAAANVLTGGLGNDTYVNPTGDTIVEAANAGSDTVLSDVGFSLEAIANVERLFLTGAAAVNGTGNALANQLLGNDAANTLTGRDGDDTINAGGGADTLNGGSGLDRLIGGLQRDKIIPGADNVSDTIVYTLIGESTGQTRDVLAGMDFNNEDRIDLPTVPTAFAPAIGTGALNLATFNQNLASVFTAAALPVGQAALFNPSSGDLDTPGMVYLIVDANGIAGYQANQDWVFQLENHTGGLDAGDFI